MWPVYLQMVVGFCQPSVYDFIGIIYKLFLTSQYDSEGACRLRRMVALFFVCH